MGRPTVLAVRIVLAMVLVGSLFVQVVMVPLMAIDLNELAPDYAYLRIPLIVIAVLAVLTVEVTFVCVWRLVTMARRGTVFSHAAFRYVNIIIGAEAAASLLTFVLGVILTPGEAVAPGMVLLIGGAGVLIAVVALIVLVLRALLAQAVARDAQANEFQAELNEVI
ncbi:MAG: DUF2975 domain-containing protein [Jiangellaceae bacterium]